MNKIYDNGYYLLGRVEDILKYANENSFDDDSIKDMIEDFKKYYDKDSIVCVHYENPMGCTWEEFTKDNIIWDSSKQD